MSDSFRISEEGVSKSSTLRQHKRIVNNKQNVEIFFEAYRSSPIILSILKLEDFTYVDINDSWIKAFGYSRQEVIGRRHSDLPLWFNPAQDEEKYNELRDSHRMQNYEVSYYRKDGSIGFGLVFSQLIIIDNHKFSLNTMIEITSRKQAEHALTESEERYRVLAKRIREMDWAQSEDRFYKVFNLNPDMIVLMNMEDNTYIEANQAVLDTYGFSREEVIGHRASELGIIASNGQMLGDLIRQLNLYGVVKDLELTTWDRSGKRIDLLVSSICINLDDKQCRLSLLKDISEKKRYEQEIARLDRLNLIGKMAASIGHEIRNPMTSVRGFLQMFNEQDENGDKKEYYDLMIEELDRANAIITEFLSLARDKKSNLHACTLNCLISRIEPMIKAEALMQGKQIKFIPGRELQLMLDENEIRQLILNLVRNGMDAMGSGGIATISTMETENEGILCVADQGSGIDPNYLEKIGIPFVSSKENGVGLGLAVCYSIAARHGARVNFETGAQGTTFKVYFPRISGNKLPNSE